MFCVCCSFLIMLFSCSSMGSPPWGIVLHQLLQHGSFLQAAAPEELLQCETFPQGAVLQGQTAAVWVALGGQRSCQKNFSGVLSTACTFPQVTSICSGMETSTACRVSALQLQVNLPAESGALPVLLHWPWCLRGCFPHTQSSLTVAVLQF